MLGLTLPRQLGLRTAHLLYIGLILMSTAWAEEKTPAANTGDAAPNRSSVSGQQVMIRTLVIRDSLAEMKKLPIHWSYVETASRIAKPREADVQTAAYPASQSMTAAALYLQRQTPQPATDELQPPLGVTSATWTEATSVVERATPVLFTLLTPEEHATLLNAIQKTESIERVMAPSVVVFSGQLASIGDCIERPFVTGIRPVLVGNEGQQQVEFEPNIKVYSEGTTMKIRPELENDQQVRLTYQLDLCKIREVETLEIPGVDGRGKFSIQMPEVASTQFRTCIEMPLDYTLAVSAFETDEQGQKQSLVVLCQCSVPKKALPAK